VSNSLDQDEAPSYSASHPDPSCLHMALWLWLESDWLTFRFVPDFQVVHQQTRSSRELYQPLVWSQPNCDLALCGPTESGKALRLQGLVKLQFAMETIDNW